ncbi:hypothetical protein B7463_g3359, partial [Scytalidium lignicola]
MREPIPHNSSNRATVVESNSSESSEVISEDLLSQSPNPSGHDWLDNPVGSWGQLANWYWEYWREIEGQLIGPAVEDQIPPKPLRDDLVVLFFKYVHPVCPIFDEVQLHDCYYCNGDDASFLKIVSPLEFQAMMFAASLHLNDQQIRKTRYISTYQCHGSLFKIAQTTYHACQNASPIVLTRAAILLSYWSPYSSEQQTNSYWIDQAFTHAVTACLHKQQPCTPSETHDRRKLIWWSCLVRDRIIALGLRRFHLLHKEVPNCSLPSLDDFGLEVFDSRFVGIPCKLQYINNFIIQCELSQVMARISRFQEQRIYTAKSADPKSTISHSELQEVISLHLAKPLSIYDI